MPEIKLTDKPIAESISNNDEVFGSQTDALGNKHICRMRVSDIMDKATPKTVTDDDSGTKYRLGIKGGKMYIEEVNA